MKRTFLVFLVIAMLLLAACAPSSGSAVSSSLAPDATSQTQQESSDFETAFSCIGQPLSVLTEQIGEPTDFSYASSCLGDGEDGELYYDGFTVYTYRDTDGTESVYDVMKTAD